MSLLEKARKLNSFIRESGSKPLQFSKLSEILSKLLDSNVYMVDGGGRVLGYALIDNRNLEGWTADLGDMAVIPNKINKQLLETSSTTINIGMGKGEPNDGLSQNELQRYTAVVPISCGGSRLGTLILERTGEKYTDDDMVLAEYSATLSGKEIIVAKTKLLEEKAREKAAVQMAIRTLSFSELDAIEHILIELDGNEGLVVASKLADRIEITRSVIVNALRKLEGAGIIESRSLGVKGTYIRILNNKLVSEFKKHV